VFVFNCNRRVTDFSNDDDDDDDDDDDLTIFSWVGYRSRYTSDFTGFRCVCRRVSKWPFFEQHLCWLVAPW